ncbi:MAG: hypothetical protein AAF558_06065 [Verrucomicrobiota bacterium]
MQFRSLALFRSLSVFFSVLGYALLAIASHVYLAFPIGLFATGLVSIILGFICALLDNKASSQFIFGFALLFRILAIVTLPIYEDDFQRYLWDGRQLVTTGNPYDSTPSDAFGNASIPENFQRILDNINYPDFPTVYGPTFQLFFAFSYLLAPGSLIVWKLVLLCLDLSILIWLYRDSSSKSVSISKYSPLLLYGWCPLLIFETHINAHADLIGISFAFIAWICFQTRFFAAMAVALAFAVGCKLFACVLIPFFLWGKNFRTWGIFLLGIALIYLPFALQGSWGGFEGQLAMGQVWEFNSLGFAALGYFFDGAIQRRFALGLTGIGMIFIWSYWKRNDIETLSAIQFCLGWGLLFSPVINPWYLLWLLPWAIWSYSITVWISFFAVLLSYCTFQNLGHTGPGLFEHPIWVRPLEFSIIAVAATYEFRQTVVLKRK